MLRALQVTHDLLAKQIHTLVTQATAANLPDLLRVLTGFSTLPASPGLLTLALQHDMASVHLLHPDTDEGLDLQPKLLHGAAATAAAASIPGQGVGPVPWQRVQSSAVRSVAVLLKELLDVAVAKCSVAAVQLLCAVPSASSLGESLLQAR